jgi:hypothetical protein
MHSAVEIGEFEVRRLDRGERGAARNSSFAEKPYAMVVVVDHRLS